MNVSSIGNYASSYMAPMRQASSEASEPAGAPEHDGDRDDGAVQAAASHPTLNTAGQVVGQRISVTA